MSKRSVFPDRVLLVVLGALMALATTDRVYGIDTVGSYLWPIDFNHGNLTAIEWTSTMEEYEGQAGPDFRLRLDFHFVEMQGVAGNRALTTGIQNVYHTFLDDQVMNPPPPPSPGLNLYWSSLLPGLPDGVALDADPLIPPYFGRVFENVDGIGNIGNNIYNRATLGIPLPTNPIEVRWSVRRIGVETNPPAQLTRDLNGTWIPLIGTFAVWKCEAVINGKTWNIATYYLPVEYCEFLNAQTPIKLTQEHFEVNGGALDRRRTKVRYSDFRVSNGVDWFPLKEWMIVFRIDDERGNNDNRFGWYPDGDALYSVCGATSYETTAYRDPGQMFFLGDAASCSSSSIPASCDPDCNANGVGDGCDISASTSADCNLNGVPDECEGGTFSLLELRDAFCIVPDVNHLRYDRYADNRTGGIPGPGNQQVAPLAFAGTLDIGAGSAHFVGPVYNDATYFYPDVQHDLVRDFVVVHPGAQAPSGATSAGAAVSFSAPFTSKYRILGDFARANDSRLAGDGVDVAVFKQFNADAPLFGGRISSNHAVDPNAPFSGTSVAHFDISADLSADEKLRFVVFPGPPGDLDIGFDATALRFSVWGNNDCNANGVPDSCDLSNGTSQDVNGNGVPDECDPRANDIVWDPATNPIPWPNNNPLATTRSLAFKVVAPGPPGPSKVDAIKVCMVDLQNPVPPNAVQFPPQNFHAFDLGSPAACASCTAEACPGNAGGVGGCCRWVGPWVTVYESQGPPLAGPSIAARLQCTPYYWDWKSKGPIWVVGAEIMPSSQYSVQTYASTCAGNEATCTNVSAPVTMYTRRSGDVEAPYNPPTNVPQPNAIDLAQVVNKFKSVVGAPVKCRAQLQPNLPELNADVNAIDIVSVVDAIGGKAYPYAGPCPCPSKMLCRNTPCATPAVCVALPAANGGGAGAMCVKTCVGGSADGQPCIGAAHCPGAGAVCRNGGASPGFCRDKCGRCGP
jgi:hypothetical protein